MHDAWHMPGSVDDRIPLPSAQPLNVGVTVTHDLLGLRNSVGRGLATIEQSYFVTARQGILCSKIAHEPGPAKKQNFHVVGLPIKNSVIAILVCHATDAKTQRWRRHRIIGVCAYTLIE